MTTDVYLDGVFEVDVQLQMTGSRDVPKQILRDWLELRLSLALLYVSCLQLAIVEFLKLPSCIGTNQGKMLSKVSDWEVQEKRGQAE